MHADQLIVADHGGVVFAARYELDSVELHRLDLTTRRCTFWARVPGRRVAASFDGRTLIVVSDGLTFLDTLTPRPSLTWREFDSEVAIEAVARNDRQLTALVRVRRSGRTVAWSAGCGRYPTSNCWPAPRGSTGTDRSSRCRPVTCGS